MDFLPIESSEYLSWYDLALEEYIDELKEINFDYNSISDIASKEFRESLENGLETENSYIYKAIEANNIVGYIWFIDRGEAIFISHLLVLPECRKKGYGHQIMKWIENLSNTIMLHVFKHNIEAINLYDSLGYSNMNVESEESSLYMVKHIDVIEKELTEDCYKYYPFTVKYKTDYYYDYVRDNDSFKLDLKMFDHTVEKTFNDRMFDDWLSKPTVYGLFMNESLVGFIEGSIESWNNRFRISNIHIDENLRKKGYGSRLINKMIHHAQKLNMRMIVLETQSCNYPAISFYKKNGFQIIGFDLFAYSNDDVLNKEFRIEMGKALS